MTKSFSTLVAALAISASFVAVTTSVSAFTATDDLARVRGGEVATAPGPVTRTPPIANGDLGSGRGVVTGPPISSGDLGSGRIADGPISGTDLGSGR